MKLAAGAGKAGLARIIERPVIEKILGHPGQDPPALPMARAVAADPGPRPWRGQWPQIPGPATGRSAVTPGNAGAPGACIPAVKRSSLCPGEREPRDPALPDRGPRQRQQRQADRDVDRASGCGRNRMMHFHAWNAFHEQKCIIR